MIDSVLFRVLTIIMKEKKYDDNIVMLFQIVKSANRALTVLVLVYLDLAVWGIGSENMAELTASAEPFFFFFLINSGFRGSDKAG